MRRPEFEQWLSDQKYAKGSVTTFSPDAHRVERDETLEVDLDKEFKKDGMKSIIELYSYTEQDALDINKPKPRMVFKPNDPNKPYSESLKDYKKALKHYRDFCEKHPPK